MTPAGIQVIYHRSALVRKHLFFKTYNQSLARSLARSLERTRKGEKKRNKKRAQQPLKK